MNIDQDELDLLSLLLSEEGVERQSGPAIPRIPDDLPSPASFQQERLWLLQQMDPDAAEMNMSAALRLQGPLRVEALESALSEIVRRHEPLRTTFAPGASGPVQMVAAARPLSLEVEDFTAIVSSDRDERVLAAIQDEMRRPFDLTRGPVVRMRLLRCGPEAHVLTLALHHIIADGWSIGVFAAELGALYRAFSLGMPSPFPELPVRYRDYSVWQRGRFTDRLSEGLGYWREQLRDLAALELPTDRNRPAQPGRIIGGRQPFSIEPDICAKLRACAEKEGATLAMATLASLQILLARYSNQSDIAVGMPVANRNLSELEGLIGFFVNLLVIRSEYRATATFRQLLRDVRETTLAAYDWQEVPFQLLVDELKPDRVANRHPLFQVAFAFQNAPQVEPELTDLIMSRVDDDQTVRFDLEIFIGEKDGGLAGSIAYDRRLYDATTIERLSEHWMNLVGSLAASPDAALANHSLLSRAARLEAIEGFNDTARPTPGTSLNQLFARQVQLSPDAPAVILGQTQWTFAELENRAAAVAAHLLGSGFGPEQVAAIRMERCPELVAAILGVLRAGGAYLPLDSAHPSERLEYMIRDSRAVVVLGRGAAPDGNAIPWVDVDCLSPCAAAPAWAEPDPQSLAYLIYTSGSTGMPKGSEITHGGLLNYLAWATEAYEVADGAGSPLHSSIAFDLTVTSLFPALLSGRPVIVVPETAGAGGLATALRSHPGASPLKLTPAHLAVLNNLVAPHEAADCARVFVIGGEQLLPEHVAFWHRYAPLTRLINEYGPTETVVGCCVHEVTDADLDREAIPIGKPIANTSLYVLDKGLEPTPPGIPGELWIAGAGLARGYRFRSELTAAAFRPDPFGSNGQRMYRTGDRVRRRVDGTLEFLGRIDEQIKLRGYRIELGEIEAVLARHESVREAVALVRADRAGDQRLVAYVVPATAEQALPGGTKQWETEQVDQWRTMFERNYELPPQAQDPTFNPIGWDSSYDGQPLPDDDIREWLADTVAQLVATSPRRALEIGCGSGLILFAVAPSTESYLASDFAAGSVATVGRLAAERGLRQVRLLHREASNFADIPPHSFDCIIVNSVVQYFPSADYLAAVIRGAIQAAAEGALIFIGDVRNLALLSAYHASVQFYKADAGMKREELAERVRRAIAREEELVIDPDFFRTLQQIFPEISAVEIRPRTSRRVNELTKFRYDALLRIGPVFAGSATEGPRELSTEVAMALADDLQVRDWLQADASGDEWPETVGEMRERLLRGTSSIPQTPVAIPPARAAAESLTATEAPSQELALSLLRPYTNNPLHAKLAQTLFPVLRRYLSSRLPDYMLPSDFVLLDSLPLTVNGKVDRRMLPAPVPGASPNSKDYVAPRGPEEAMLVEIWTDLLGVPRVGITDNFFDLGGHSLLAAQVVSRIRLTMGVETPLALLFEAPTIALLAERISELRGSDEDPAPPLVPLGRSKPLPLSFAQERLWFLEQLEPGRTTLHVPVLLRLSGELAPAALERSLAELQRRHESLRTRLVEENGIPYQVPGPVTPLKLRRHDLSSLPEQGRESEARVIAEREFSHLFDLSTGPLLRATLIRLADREHMLGLVTHHIVSDGWSVGVAIRELVALYAAFLRGEPSPLAELPLQYADYAGWQRQWLQGDVLERKLSWWRSNLAALPVVELAADFPRPQVLSGAGGRQPFAFSSEVADQIHSLSRNRGATLFMTLLAGFYAWLRHETGQRDLVVGTTVANRQRQEIEPLIGFFVNTLALRMDCDDDLSFNALLDRTRQLCLDAWAHQDAPFEAVVESVSPGRDGSRSPLFQIAIVLLNAPRTELSLEGLTLREEPLDAGVSKFDLTLLLQETPQGLNGEWEFSTDLFTPETIRRFSAHFGQLVSQAVTSPELPLHQLSILGPAERQRVLRDFNATHRPVRKLTIPELFETQAARTPACTAVVDGDVSLTYAELNARANRFARHLIRLGIGSEDRVALVLPRSLEMVVALLGVMKAGAAYVPMDPDYPEARLAQMMADAKPSLVITELPPLAEDLRETNPTDQDRIRPLHIENAAYVIYTSGSTGVPKGVVLSHSGIASLAFIHIERLQITQHSRFLQFASFSFDSSVVELVMTLGAGAALVITPADRRSGAGLQAFIRREQITHAQLPPAVLATLQADEDSPITNLIVAGEACSADVYAAWSNKVRFFNAYGPTESTVCATLAGPCTGAGAPPIGPPVWNTQAYILDRRLNPVSPGAVAELYLAGAGIARGYLNRPEMTAERFLPDPYSAMPGSRMYRTGDLARWRPDGSLDFLGRADHQVKIRGFRIEPGEIEATLRLHPAVAQAAVIAREDGPGGKQLTAYLVPQEEAVLDSRDLRAFVAARLPHYMVPSHFMLLAALPLSPNGKLDRAALPVPGRETSTVVLQPRTLLESQLQQIWEKILGASPIGVRDGFFDLGGHSLLAPRLLAEVERRTGARLPLNLLFQAGTIEAMASAITDGLPQPTFTALVPIKPEGSLPPLVFVHPAAGSVLSYYAIAKALPAEQPFYALQAPGHDGQGEPLTGVEKLAETYLPILREAFPHGPYHLGGHSFGAIVAYEMACRLEKEKPGSVGALILLDPPAPHSSAESSTPEIQGAGLLAFLAGEIGAHFGVDIQVSEEELSKLDDASQLKLVVDRAIQAGVSQSHGEIGLIAGMAATYRASVQAEAQYRPQPLNTGLTIFVTDDAQDDQGWATLAREVQLRRVEGDHKTMVRPPYVESLAAVICEELNRVVQNCP